MYSGITGEEFAADIFLGVVFYQRLRHMVLDKFQVRTTGPVDPVTRQPVKVSTTILPPRARARGIPNSQFSQTHACGVVVRALTYSTFPHRAANALEASDSARWSATRLSLTAPRSCYKTDS